MIVFSKLGPHSARTTLPERQKLLQNHGFDLVFIPLGPPKVFIHNEVMQKIVFIVDEDYSGLAYEGTQDAGHQKVTIGSRSCRASGSLK